MEDSGIDIKETVSASKKLDDSTARDLLADANKLIAAKGKKVTEFKKAELESDDAVAAMLGPTGNLRAPTLRVGKTLLVGFDADTYEREFH